MLADHPPYDFIGQLFPTKEDWPLFGLEGAEARIRGRRQLDVEDGIERLSGRQSHQTRSKAPLASTSQLWTSIGQTSRVVSIH